jgi:TonB-linked SusC/RagA family outer membrane protein
MEEETIGLEEVVAIGYGTQKKVNLTGSVTAIKAEELTAVAVPNLSQSIMGKSPGVFIKNVNGQPGDETSIDYNIRGFGEPLLIIDGMPATKQDFNRLDPNEIENFSVLKDAAAAAIYGARAGNGVILVTTKRGETGLEITYTNNYSLQYVTKRPEFVSSEQMARMENLARQNMAREPIWTDEQLQKFRDGSDPQYPNTDWWNETMRKFAPQLQQNLNVRGGTEKVKYFVSGSHFYQEGLLKADETKLDRYNFRSNVDISLTDKLSLGVDLNVTTQNYSAPVTQMERGYSGGWVGLMIWVFRSAAYKPTEWPDPTKLVGRSPYDLQLKKNAGYIDQKSVSADTKLTVEYKLPFGFNTKAIFHIFENNDRYKDVWRKVPHWDYNWETDTYSINNYTNPYSRVYERSRNNHSLNAQYFLNWAKQISEHSLNAMMVYEYLSNDYNWFDAMRRDYAFDIDYLSAGPDLNKTNSGSATEGGRMGFISRFNYDYKGKYLVELNGRYDASPLFPKDTRWGFFPSASIGWRISEESFIRDNLPFVDNIKIRASYGQLGYDAISTFQYLETFAMRTNYIFDSSSNTLVNGIRSDGIPNPNITWEKMTSSNAGIDFSLWNNKLEGSIDYFYRLRSDVLGSRILSLPNTVGAVMPSVNYAEYDNRGVEFSLHYRSNIGAFSYNVGGNISTNRQKIVLRDQVEFASAEARRTGNVIGEWSDRWWGIMTDGLFQTQEEIDNWADQDGKNNATIYPGDVKKIDYNGDGRITNEDRVVIGGSTFPRLNYGLDFSASWKNFDFSMLWQGAGLFEVNLRQSSDLSLPFFGANTPIKDMWENSYTPENQWIPTNTTNAVWPIYGNESWGSRSSYQFSDFWLVKGDYIRLKNLQIGYFLPENLIQRVRLKSCKVYVSGYNLLTFSALDFMDPEIDTNVANFAAYYPPTGTYNAGVVIKF